MGALHNLSTYANRIANLGHYGGVFDLPGQWFNKFVGRETNPTPGPQAIPVPDPQALALEQRRMIARQAATGEGRAATILSQQPTSDRLGP